MDGKGGRYGEQENTVIENSVIAIGWNELPDLSKREDMGVKS